MHIATFKTPVESRSRYLLLTYSFLLIVGLLMSNPIKAETKAAIAEDVDSIDHIMSAIYDVISGPAGAKRDWDRMRSLFIDDARLIPQNGNGTVAFSVEEYIKRAEQAFEENGFFEQEITREIDRYGNIVQIFSSYEAKRNAHDVQPFLRGINSFQLLYENNRWWIVTIFWQAESMDNPIPEQYLKPLVKD